MLKYFLVSFALITFFSCRETPGNRVNKRLGEDSLSNIEIERVQKSDLKTSETTILLDTVINNKKISFSYDNPFKFLNDSFDFKGILKLETNGVITEDTLILKTTDIESGFQKIMVANESTNFSNKIFLRENFIFFSLAFYPGQLLYIIEVEDQKINLIKAAEGDNPIYSENGFIINRGNLKTLALYANRESRDYNAVLYKIISKNGILRSNKIKISNLDYDASSLTQSDTRIRKINDEYLK